MLAEAYVVGVDFGTLSGRAVVVRVSDGAELGSAVYEFPHGAWIEWPPPARRSPQWALQDPGDWVGVLRTAVPAAVQDAGVDPSDVIGIGTDFTASTPLPVLRDGTPLCWLDGSARRQHAWAQALEAPRRPGRQADRINALDGGSAASRGSSATAARSPPSGSSPRRSRCSRRTRSSTSAMEALGRGAPTGSSGSSAASRRRNLCTAGYKGDPPGRPLAVRGLPGARWNPRLRRLRRRRARGAR